MQHDAITGHLAMALATEGRILIGIWHRAWWSKESCLNRVSWKPLSFLIAGTSTYLNQVHIDAELDEAGGAANMHVGSGVAPAPGMHTGGLEMKVHTFLLPRLCYKTYAA